MRDAVIVGAVRTPVGKRGGLLRDWHPVDLSAHVLQALAARTGIDPDIVDDVVWGCVTQVGEQAGNVGRSAVLAAGWPESVPGTTIDRQCGSSQQAVHFAAAAVASGQQGVVVAGGVESMTRVPMGAGVVNGPGAAFGPRLMARYDHVQFNQGLSAEAIADRWGIDRAEADEFALRSHARAAAAADDGRFASEIVPVPVAGGAMSDDEGIRRGGTAESMAALRSAFKEGGTVTAGNSSQISDAAAALLITTRERAAELGLMPLARFAAFAVAGADPVMMLTAPMPATERVLERAGLRVGDIGAFEVNEAFASVPLAWLRDLGADPDIVNPNGGAIALGHPLGASGARLMTTLVHHMQANDIRYGVQTMCEGGGMANATVLELL